MTEQNVDTDITVAVCANEVYRRFRDYIDRDDLVQEGRLWLLSHPRLVEEFTTDDDVKRGRYRLRRDIMMSMERLARSEKAQRLGYDISDEYFYTVEKLRGAYQIAMMDMPTSPHPLAGLSVEGPRPENPVGDWTDLVCTVVDVRRALFRISIEDRQIIWDYFVMESSMEHIAKRLGVHRTTLSRRIDRIESRIIQTLGGEEPKCSGGTGCAGCRICSTQSNRFSIRSRRSGVNQLLR